MTAKDGRLQPGRTAVLLDAAGGPVTSQVDGTADSLGRRKAVFLGLAGRALRLICYKALYGTGTFRPDGLAVRHAGAMAPHPLTRGEISELASPPPWPAGHDRGR